MSKLGTFLKRYAPAPAVTFVAGLLSSIIVREIFGNVVGITVGVLSLLGIIFVVLSSASMVGLRDELKTLLVQSRLSAKVVRSRGITGDTELYDAVTKCLLSATKSIHAVSLFRPPSLEVSDARKKYYDALDKFLSEKKEPFEYQRIIQVEKVNESGVLQDDQTDVLTYAHCRHCLEQPAASSANIYLWQSSNMLGSLSFFIVDRKQVAFVIPSKKTVIASKPPGSQRDPRALPVGSVVIFSDEEGSLVDEMLGLFTELASDARRVTGCAQTAAKSA